ncbi:MAG: hypothetical protein AAGC57_12385 [Pseudomonadota bacterium]
MCDTAFEFVVLSDIQMVPSGDRIYGLDPEASLAAAVDLVNAEHGNADLVLIA